MATYSTVVPESESRKYGARRFGEYSAKRLAELQPPPPLQLPPLPEAIAPPSFAPPAMPDVIPFDEQRDTGLLPPSSPPVGPAAGDASPLGGLPSPLVGQAPPQDTAEQTALFGDYVKS